MIIISFFTDGGVPKTGLSPTIDIWEDDGTQVVTAQTMTEIAGGFYKYDFSTYDSSKNYSIRADGGVTLSGHERYNYGVNDLNQITQETDDIKGLIGTPSSGEDLVSILADIETETNKIQTIDDNVDIILIDTSEIQGKLPDNNIMGSSVKTDKDDEIDAIKAKTDNLPVDPTSETNSTSNKNEIITEVDANETKIDSIITTLSTMVADVWSYGTRTLTSFGTLIADIWNNAVRTLTSFGSLVNDTADQVWDETLSEHQNPGSTGKALEDADATADPSAVAEAVWDELTNGTGSSTFGELVRRISGLCQENFRILNPSYDVNNNLISSTIKIYPSATDVNNDTNAIASYIVTATYNAQGNMTGYKVTKS